MENVSYPSPKTIKLSDLKKSITDELASHSISGQDSNSLPRRFSFGSLTPFKELSEGKIDVDNYIAVDGKLVFVGVEAINPFRV